jgi:hypothetical protein
LGANAEDAREDATANGGRYPFDRGTARGAARNDAREIIEALIVHGTP